MCFNVFTTDRQHNDIVTPDSNVAEAALRIMKR